MKQFKSILKNSDKYSENIHLANEVILDLKRTTTREGGSGKSTCNFGRFWFKTPRGYVLFKQGDAQYYSIQKLNEILCYNLAKNMGLPCAEYFPASVNKDKKIEGIASVNFLNKNEKLISVSEMLGLCKKDIFSIMKNLEEYDDVYRIDYKQIMCSLYAYMIFDTLTYQEDRHLRNVSFILDSKNNIKMAPLYDNEYSFFLSCHLPPCYEDSFDSPEEYISSYFCGRGIIPYFSLQNVIGISSFDELLEQIAMVADKNPVFTHIFDNILQNADLRPVYKDLESQGYRINQDYKEFTIQMLDFSRNRILEKQKELNQTFIKGEDNAKT